MLSCNTKSFLETLKTATVGSLIHDSDGRLTYDTESRPRHLGLYMIKPIQDSKSIG